MGMDWNAIGSLAAQITQGNARPGTAQAQYGQNMGGIFAEQQAQEAMKKAEEERKKKERGKLFGSVGSTLGTVAGLALAPVTGGASLAVPLAAGAAGGAIGGTAGNFLGGGGFDPQQSLMYGAQGALGGLTAGLFTPAAGVGGAGVAGAAGNAGSAGLSGSATGASAVGAGAGGAGGFTAGTVAGGATSGGAGAITNSPLVASDKVYKTTLEQMQANRGMGSLVGNALTTGKANYAKQFLLNSMGGGIQGATRLVYNPQTGEYDYMPSNGMY